MRTGLTGLLGIDLPIVQAPVGGATSPELAAAVSNAGGLGTLALSLQSPEAVRRLIRATRDLTERPFGVNLILEWHQEERLDACLREGVELVSFFWGDPAPHVEATHAAGARVAHTVASAEEALSAVEAGVDVVVAQGWEAGGHVRGEVTTLSLVPRVADAVSPVPVVAAGGIADGRGLAAVLALGAAGAWVGTRFLLAEEAAIPPAYRDALARAVETDTVYSRVFDKGWEDAPHRALRNSTLEAWDRSGRPPRGGRPGEGDVVARFADGGPIERYSDVHPAEGITGELEALALYAGQGVGLLSGVLPAHEIVEGMAEEAVRILERGAELGRSGYCRYVGAAEGGAEASAATPRRRAPADGVLPDRQDG